MRVQYQKKKGTKISIFFSKELPETFLRIGTKVQRPSYQPDKILFYVHTSHIVPKGLRLQITPCKEVENQNL